MASNLDIFADAAGTMPSMSQQSGEPSKQGDESTTSTADSVSSTSACGEFPSVARIKSAFPSHKIKKHVLATQVKIKASKPSVEVLKKIIKNANENIESMTYSYTELHEHATELLEKGKRVHDSIFNNYKASVTKYNKETASCKRLKDVLSDRSKRVNSPPLCSIFPNEPPAHPSHHFPSSFSADGVSHAGRKAPLHVHQWQPSATTMGAIGSSQSVSAQPPRPQMSSIDPARRHQQEQYELAFNQQQQQHHRQLQLETGQHQQHQPECNGQLGLIDEEEGPVNTGLRYYHDGNGDVREYIDEHSEPSLPDREL
jgi:hypothetical protein